MADREVHALRLTRWIETVMKVHFVRRLKAGTWVQINRQWHEAGTLAVDGLWRFCSSVRVTRNHKVAPPSGQPVGRVGSGSRRARAADQRCL